MNRKILIICLAGILLLVAMGGSVYAATNHTYPPGSKLVGMGPIGYITSGNPSIKQVHNTNFNFSNPNCDKSIIITQISILDPTGNVVYQGPYLNVTPNIPNPTIPPGTATRTINNNPMLPHEARAISLQFFMPKNRPMITSDPLIIGDLNNWMDVGTAIGQVLGQYSVEIFWKPSGRPAVSPLIGFASHSITRYDSNGAEISFSIAEHEMVDISPLNQNQH
jgi:hypothetical protein